MDLAWRDRFVRRWGEYFGTAPLPLCMDYAASGARRVHEASGFSCLVALLRPSIEGKTVVLGDRSIGCNGGKRYAGFREAQTEGLAEFLSCGTPEREGLRYKKSPEIVREGEKTAPWIPAPAPLLVIKRIDKMQADETPEVVAFLARPDVLAALVHLAAYSTSDRDVVISPQGAGCATLLAIPRMEARQGTMRAVLGMFDLSARPYVEPDVLSLAVPWAKFVQMADDMDGSFLVTESWRKLRDRHASAARCRGR